MKLKPAPRTVIRVRITDPHRAEQLRQNFEEWAQSPASLLFFNSLKELTIEGQTIKRQPMGKGPVGDSSWVKLGGGADADRLLVLQSEAIPFPADAAEENPWRAWSWRGGFASATLPRRNRLGAFRRRTAFTWSCRPGAGLDNLPFSCNAPFIQDPARFAIKDPATSPTNRWLLQRAGRQVGKAMLEWLMGTPTGFLRRSVSAAYDLLKGAVQFGTWTRRNDAAKSSWKTFWPR